MVCYSHVDVHAVWGGRAKVYLPSLHFMSGQTLRNLPSKTSFTSSNERFWKPVRQGNVSRRAQLRPLACQVLHHWMHPINYVRMECVVVGGVIPITLLLYKSIVRLNELCCSVYTFLCPQEAAETPVCMMSKT